MQLTTAVWTIIILALLSANLPFVNQRVFALIPIKNSSAKKSIWIRLLELIVAYFLIGALGYLFESSIGNVFPQGWEFYAVSGCLFIVFSFPGFVYQYLRRS
jgi:hypothetical protein